VEEAEKRDISCLRDVIIPQLKKLNLSQAFWLQFTKTLHKRESVDAYLSSHAWHHKHPALGAIVDECLQIALQKTDVNELFRAPFSGYSYHGREAGLCEHGMARTSEILKLCLSMKRLDACDTLLQKLLAPCPQGELESRFASFFTPFVPKLKTLLQKHEQQPDTPPFKAFFKALIRRYNDRLVSKPPTGIDVKQWKPKKIGCGCTDCEQLDSFITSLNKERETFRMAAKRRDHLAARITASNASDGQFYSMETIRTGSPQGLMVTKSKTLVAASRWITQKAKFDAFLRSIGDAELLKSILSNDGDEDHPANPTPQAPLQVDAGSTSNSTLVASSSTAQGKRKRDKSDVIDLTLDD